MIAGGVAGAAHVNKYFAISKMAASTSTKPKHFASFDEEEFAKILDNKDADNTKRSTKQAIKIFNEYLFEKNIDIDLVTVDKKTLAAILGKFYVELRKTDGSHYKNIVVTCPESWHKQAS